MDTQSSPDRGDEPEGSPAEAPPPLAGGAKWSRANEGITTTQDDVVDGDIPRVLQVYPVGVDAETGGGDGEVEDLHRGAAVELEVALWTVANGYPIDSDAVTAVEPQSLNYLLSAP